jgi:surface antigen
MTQRDTAALTSGRSTPFLARTGRRAGAVLLGLTTVLGVALSVAVPATAVTNASRACDAMCAQSTVHQPATATSFDVRWRRYPYAQQKDVDAIDQWGNTERQCTGYATWALNNMGVDFGMRDLGPNGRKVRFLAARSWAKTARRGGWNVSRTPVVGAVAQWRAHEASHWQTKLGRASFTAGRDGHVGIVSHVYADGTVLIRQYNVGDPDRSYSTMRAKAPRYLDIGVK